MIEMLLQAERAMALGLVDQAEGIYRQLVDTDPRNAVAVVGLARVALERRQDRLAYDLAVRALEIDPQDAAALRMEARLSEVLVTRGEAVQRPAFVVPSAPGTAAPSTPQPAPPRPASQPTAAGPASPESTHPAPSSMATPAEPAPRSASPESIHPAPSSMATPAEPAPRSASPESIHPAQPPSPRSAPPQRPGLLDRLRRRR